MFLGLQDPDPLFGGAFPDPAPSLFLIEGCKIGLKIMSLWFSYKKKIWRKIYFFASLNSLKKEVGSGSGSSVIQRYGSADQGPHQKSRVPNTASSWLVIFEVISKKLGPAHNPDQ
jgi:hypothetical protein